jgi:hypothetical protein
MRIRAILASASLVLAGTTALAQNVSYHIHKGTNFSKFRTYTWVRGTELIDPLNHHRIVRAVDAQLTGKGLVHVAAGASPDALISYHASFDTTLKPAGTKAPAPAPGGATSPAGSELLIGTLVVEIVDTKTKKSVWRGKVTNAIDSYADADKRESRINHIAALLFQNYPPRP